MPDIWQPLAPAQSFLSRGAGKKCSELQIEWEQLPLIITTLCFFRPIIEGHVTQREQIVPQQRLYTEYTYVCLH